MNVKVNQANLRRVAIHIGLAAAGAAVAAMGLDLSHSSNPEVVAVAGMLTGALGSFIRQEQAVNDSGGQVAPLDTLKALASNRSAEEAAFAEIAGAFGYSKATTTVSIPSVWIPPSPGASTQSWTVSGQSGSDPGAAGLAAQPLIPPPIMPPAAAEPEPEPVPENVTPITPPA